MPAASVLVLGGYGHFGGVISRRLAAGGLEVVVAGRDGAKAAAFASPLGVRSLSIDAASPALAQRLHDSRAGIVVSTAGPFQQQDYRVARAAIAAGMHYLDIADGRAFVCGITALDAEARTANCLVVSGVSSVPALSAAVVDRYLPEFRELLEIDAGISSSATPPGEATLRGVLGYCGRPLQRWHDGAWTSVSGLEGLRLVRFTEPPMSRWISDCDVPDLELFPRRYPTLRSHRFGAGTASPMLQAMLVPLAWLVRRGWLRDLGRWSGAMHRAARVASLIATRRSAMFVEMRGVGHDTQPLRRRWELRAEEDHGLNVPCLGAVALVRKLAAGAVAQRGAMPCLGLLGLEEYLTDAADLKIHAGLVA